MSARRVILPGAREAASACAEALAKRMGEAIAKRGRAMIAVSGGSTPKLMFEALAGMRVPWEQVHLFFVDERAVGPEHELSNYGMTRRHLLEPAGVPGANVHRIEGEREPAEAARLYTETVRRVFGLASDGMPEFDAVQCGIGADAHTASLFPGEALIGDRLGIAAAVHVQKLGQWRITLLPGVLMHARVRLVLASGDDKAAALRCALKSPWDPAAYPSQLLTSAGLATEFYIDRAAAGELDPA